jgi:hypothetical protein
MLENECLQGEWGILLEKKVRIKNMAICSLIEH